MNQYCYTFKSVVPTSTHMLMNIIFIYKSIDMELPPKQTMECPKTMRIKININFSLTNNYVITWYRKCNKILTLKMAKLKTALIRL